MKIKVRHLLMVASFKKYVATVRKMIRASVFEVETIWNIIFFNPFNTASKKFECGVFSHIWTFFIEPLQK